MNHHACLCHGAARIVVPEGESIHHFRTQICAPCNHRLTIQVLQEAIERFDRHGVASWIQEPGRYVESLREILALEKRHMQDGCRCGGAHGETGNSR